MKMSVTLLRERILIIVLLMIVSAAMLGALASNATLPNVMDYFNHVGGIVQAQSAMAEGQFPLRIAPVEYHGWRYPFFQFYSPTTYTLSGLIYHWLTPTNPIIAYKLTLWMMLVLGGAYMYRLANWLVQSRPAAILASVMYLASPYYLILIDHLGGFSESLALGMVPSTLFYTLQRYYHPADNKTLLKMSLCWYLLATIHSVTFAYTSISVGLLLFLVTLNHKRHWLNLFDTGIAYIFGIILSLWYLAPLFVFKNFLNTNHMYGRVIGFDKYKPSLKGLLGSSKHFTTGTVNSAGLIDSIATIHPSVGYPILFGVVICLYMVFKKIKFDNQRVSIWLVPLLCVFALAFLLVLSPSHLASLLPRVLMIGQYSWRILSQVIWIGALLFACGTCWLFKNKLDARHITVGLFLILSATSAWIPLREKIPVSVDIRELIRNPSIAYTAGAYLIEINHNADLIDAIDNIDMSGVLTKSQLILNTEYKLPWALFSNAQKPQLILQGDVPEKSNWVFEKISAQVAGSEVAVFELKAGPFDWRVPIENVRKFGKNIYTVPVIFKTNKKSHEKLALPIGQVVLSGFQNPDEFIGLRQSESACEQKQSQTICQFHVASEIKLIELPVIYYPELLNVTLNGRVIPYGSILYGNVLLTTIKPIPGVVNTISIEFRGLVWANTLSTIGWGMWLFFLLYIILKSISNRDMGQSRP